jgi:hypothetical protein
MISLFRIYDSDVMAVVESDVTNPSSRIALAFQWHETALPVVPSLECSGGSSFKVVNDFKTY